ncbi:MAG: TlpA family protein disulfide reductase [Saprospiraceae bacterium]
MKFNKSLLLLIAVLVIAYIGRMVYMQPKVVNGENSPTIAGKLMNGEAFDLKDLKGKYVLVDFWGSWCGPCMVEMPGIKMLNEKYKAAQFKNADGLTLLSVAIERDETRWKRAVERIGMPWKHHIADLTTSFKFINSPIAAEFGVKQVPSKFLLDENGVIIGVNQSIEELDNFLTKRLK